MFKRKLSFIVIVVVVGSILMSCCQCFADESFDLDTYKKSVKQWQDLKYGLFVCWGPASIGGKGIGWVRNAPRAGNPNPWYPPKENLIDAEVYDNLYKQFNPVDFDADEWMRMAKKAGFKYFVFLTKHCDGFIMWDTNTSDYNIMNTPYGKDICKEIADACHKHGIKLGWYYAPCDWYDPDCRHPEHHDIYIKRMKEQLRELMSNYGKISMLWADTDGGNAPWDQDNTYAMIRKLQPGIMINNRMEYNRLHMGAGYVGWANSARKRLAGQATGWKDFGDYDAAAENHVGAFNPLPHESCMSMLKGAWTWIPDRQLYSATEGSNFLVNSLIGNGNFLYNVAPMPNGEIEDRQKERLLKTGAWLDKVGQAVYETSTGPIPGGRWGGTMTKGKNVYLFLPDGIVNDWDKSELYPLTPLDKKLVAIESLTGEKVSAVQSSDGVIEITLPEATKQRKDGQADYMIMKLTFDGVSPQIKAGTTLSQENRVKQSKVRPGSNIAFLGTASMEPASAWGHIAQHAIDGNNGTIAQSAAPVWDLKIDLGKEYPVDKIRIYPSAGGWASEYTIKVSTDNENWTTVDTVANAQDQLRTIDFVPLNARYVWMDVTGVGHERNYGHAIYEFEIFLAATASSVDTIIEGFNPGGGLVTVGTGSGPQTRLDSLTFTKKKIDIAEEKKRKRGKPMPVQLSYHDDEIMMFVHWGPAAWQGVDKEIGLSVMTAAAEFEPVKNHFVTDDDFSSFDFGIDNTYVFANSQSTQVLKTKDDGLHIHMAANHFGAGRSIYMAGLPYSLANSRLLHRALFWAAGKEGDLKKWYSSNLNTDCASYPEAGTFAVVNNVDTKQETVVYDGQGQKLEIVLKPYELKWFAFG